MDVHHKGSDYNLISCVDFEIGLDISFITAFHNYNYFDIYFVVIVFDMVVDIVVFEEASVHS